jgi:PAS domain S-box-containing protein
MNSFSALSALAGANAFSEDLFRHLPIGIALYKPNDGSIQFMNEHFGEIYGWPSEELTNMQDLYLKIFPEEEYRSATLRKIQDDTAAGNAGQVLWPGLKITTQSGETRVVNIGNIPLVEKTLRLSTVTDVTGEVMKLQALESRTEELRRIMDSSLDMIFAIDENDTIVSVNAASEAILGYSPDELIGKSLFDYIYPPDKESSQQIASAVKAGRKVTYAENRYVHKNGSVVPLLWSATADRKKKMRYGIARDATEIKKSKAALIHSEKLYRYLFDNNPIPICIWDFETGQFVDCNEEAARKYGYTKEKFLKLTIWDIRPKEELAAIEQATRSEEAYGTRHKRVWRHQKRNGEIMYMDVRGQLIDYNGRRASLILAQDVTERRYYQELDNLEKQVLELVAKNEKQLTEIIAIYLEGIESLHPGVLCSVFEKRDDRLFCLAAPNLPREVCGEIEVLPVADNSGSSGTAAFLKEKVIVYDTATDVRWQNLRGIAAKYQLKACWSYPILDRENEVLATFTMYYKGMRRPSMQEENTVDRTVRLLRIILENHRHYHAIQISNERFEYAAEATSDIIWDWNLDSNSVYYSNNMQKLLGHSVGMSYDNLPFYFENVHPDDRERVMLYPEQVKYGKMTHWTQEYRFRKANGEYAWLLDRGIVIRNENGVGKRMIGAMQDVTVLKKQNERLTEIAFINAHEIRKPVASLLGLLQLFKNTGDENPDPELLKYFGDALKELDAVITQIINKTAD